MKVPAFDAAREFAADRDALLEAAERVLTSGQYILGPEVEAFEDECSDYLGTRHAIGVASGTDALDLALRAVGVGPGDTVAIPAFTFFATASAVLNAGATPVFVDVEPDTLNLDPELLEDALAADPTPKAVVPVHLYGASADMGRTLSIARRFGVSVIEDAAQAFGAEFDGQRAGSIGDLGCTSFFPTKNLGGFGDGGLVTTDDDTLAQRVRMLRAHGSRHKYVHELVGTNSRLDAVQAAMLRVRLRRIDDLLAARRANAAAYDEALSGLEGLSVPVEGPDCLHTYNQYVVRIQGGRRDEVARRLADLGIGTGVYYPSPVHLQDAVADLDHRLGDFPVAEQACEEVLALPVFPTLTAEERGAAIEALTKVLVEEGGQSAVGRRRS